MNMYGWVENFIGEFELRKSLLDVRVEFLCDRGGVNIWIEHPDLHIRVAQNRVKPFVVGVVCTIVCVIMAIFFGTDRAKAGRDAHYYSGLAGKNIVISHLRF